ncbi:MAG: DUF2269 family protein [Acidimicrobiia bacterium]|nr:DUF2269 family protein [Acidimicrobiia bacterium]
MGALLLFLHIIGAGVWLGASVTQFVVTPALRNAGGAPAAAWMRQTVRLGTAVLMPAAVLLLVTGVWMVLREDVYEFEQAFVAIGIAMVVVGAVLGTRVFGPEGKKAAESHEAGDEAAASESHRRIAMFGAIDVLLLLFTIWAMVKRLGL